MAEASPSAPVTRADVELLQSDAACAPPPEPPARDSCGLAESPSEPPEADEVASCAHAWAQLRIALNPLNDRAYEGYNALDDASIPELNASVAVPAARRPEQGRRSLSAALRTLWAYAGPGLLVSVGYMDPGNWCAALPGAGACARARAAQSARISENALRVCAPRAAQEHQHRRRLRLRLRPAVRGAGVQCAPPLRRAAPLARGAAPQAPRCCRPWERPSRAPPPRS